MQSLHYRNLASPASPFFLPVKPRFDSDPSRFALNLSFPSHLELPGVASLPSPPMSGSPPPPSPPEVSQISTLRRKRSHSPTPTAAALQVSFPPAPRALYVPVPRTSETPRFMGAVQQQIPSFPSTFQPPLGYGYGQTAGAFGPPSFLPSSQTLPSQQEAPSTARTTRKAKAHVASACVNCKKKHLRCDNARPCRRCVQSGKEDTCEDVTHKKRGRPPLKAEENQSRRPYETSLGPLVPPGGGSSGIPAIGAPLRYQQPPTQQASAPRDLRPMASPAGRRRPPPLFQSYQAPRPVPPSQITPSGHRPFSSESSSSSRPASPYFSSPLYSPPLEMPAPRGDAYGRPYPPTSTSPYGQIPGAPSIRLSPQFRQYQSINLISSSVPPPFPSGPATHHEPSQQQEQQGLSSSLQLPPIRPMIPRVTSAPVLPSESSTPQPQAQTYQVSESEGVDQRERGLSEGGSAGPRESKRQRMDLGGMLRRTEPE